MEKPCKGHWSSTKRILKYLKRTQCLGLMYSKVDDFSMFGYCNLDFDGEKETRVSSLGYLMSLGSAALSWRTHKLSILVDSTIEV